MDCEYRNLRKMYRCSSITDSEEKTKPFDDLKFKSSFSHPIEEIYGKLNFSLGGVNNGNTGVEELHEPAKYAAYIIFNPEECDISTSEIEHDVEINCQCRKRESKEVSRL